MEDPGLLSPEGDIAKFPEGISRELAPQRIISRLSAFLGPLFLSGWYLYLLKDTLTFFDKVHSSNGITCDYSQAQAPSSGIPHQPILVIFFSEELGNIFK